MMKKYRIEEQPRMTVDTGLSAKEYALYETLLRIELETLATLQSTKQELGIYKSFGLIQEINRREKFIAELQSIGAEPYTP